MSTNDVTGDKLITKELSKEGKENFDKIFPPKKRKQYVPPPLPGEEDSAKEKNKATNGN